MPLDNDCCGRPVLSFSSLIHLPAKQGKSCSLTWRRRCLTEKADIFLTLSGKIYDTARLAGEKRSITCSREMQLGKTVLLPNKAAQLWDRSKTKV